jgi:hypothetical protein
MKENISRIISEFVLVTVTLLFSVLPGRGQVTDYSDNFPGPTLDPSWSIEQTENGDAIGFQPGGGYEVQCQINSNVSGLLRAFAPGSSGFTVDASVTLPHLAGTDTDYMLRLRGPNLIEVHYNSSDQIRVWVAQLNKNIIFINNVGYTPGAILNFRVTYDGAGNLNVGYSIGTNASPMLIGGCSGIQSTVSSLSQLDVILNKNDTNGSTAVMDILHYDQAPTLMSIGGDFTYSTNAGALTITGYTGPGGALSIPAEINGLPVVSIGADAFYNNSTLSGINIPEGVTNIEASAFEWCSGLINATIPASVASIGSFAFDQCYNLTSVYFYGNAPIADSTVFEYDDKATAYYLSGTTGWGSYIGGIPTALWNGVTTGNGNQFIYATNSGAITVTQYIGPGGGVAIPAAVNGLPVTCIGADAFFDTGVSSVSIPSSVTNIGASAFEWCGELTNVVMTNGLGSIGDYAFHACTNLAHVAIPGGVTAIGNYAFWECYNLSNVVLSYGISSLGDYSFSDCTRLKNIDIPGSITNIGNYIFAGSGLANTTIPGNVSSIGDNAFYGCGNLVNVVISNGVVNLGNYAFGDCTNLTDTAIPGSVVNIGVGAFWECYRLNYITIPSGVTSVGDYAFYDCTSLDEVTIPASITNLGSGIFWGCSSLVGVTISPGVSSIGDFMFYGCSNLISANLPNSVTSIGDYAFAITGLTTATIPNSVTNIGEGALFDCGSLVAITLGNGVVTVGDYAFEDCPSLNSVYFYGNAPYAGSYSFLGDTNATIYYLPGTSGWGSSFASLPAVPWLVTIQTGDANFGLRSNSFGFNITGPANAKVVVESCTNIADPVWVPLQTNVLTGVPLYFNDTEWRNHSAQFYRLRSP